MVRVYIICEGQTEETFVRELLMPHFSPRKIFLNAILIGNTGGNVTFDRLRQDTENLLLGDRNSYCTTFFDFYGLPTDFPGKPESAAKVDLSAKVSTIHTELVNKLKGEIRNFPAQRFIPYVQMYEFEALLFSDPASFAAGIERRELQDKLADIRALFETPEHINDDQCTAPSKRVKKLFSLNDNDRYEKPIMGTLAALEIGLAKMREECSLFDTWLAALEDLPAQG